MPSQMITFANKSFIHLCLIELKLELELELELDQKINL